MYILRQSWVSLIVQKFKLLILVLCRQSFNLFSLQFRALVPRSVAGVPTGLARTSMTKNTIMMIA